MVKKYYGFRVRPVIGGFIGQIGCRELVFKTLVELADVLRAYWEDPNGTIDIMLASNYDATENLPTGEGGVQGVQARPPDLRDRLDLGGAIDKGGLGNKPGTWSR